MTILSMLFIKLFPILFIVIFAAVAGFSAWAFFRSRSGEETSAPAKAVLKLCTVRGGRTAETVYSAEFETEKNGRLTLTVPEELFGGFSCGDSGRLTYRGAQLVSFERE